MTKGRVSSCGISGPLVELAKKKTLADKATITNFGTWKMGNTKPE